MGAYGRLLRYVAAIKGEVALKVLIGLAISTTYIGQAMVMAKAVSVVFLGGVPLTLPCICLQQQVASIENIILSQSYMKYIKKSLIRLFFVVYILNDLCFKPTS
ncbi:hypothetical protein [Desulfosporosinus hippei]|uniref:Uncharacterized protein n=1 Tax=Desulfosporosinus hippei DSM 8344 TaxID=1121419 RepID=A0A1G7T3T6_9FIRM|nr:hypothetical protein [Desulfosporosinus hippei]SDG29996.1 hypothetical protein SAMN05443529_10290 [Desulfosporosinus hippei DSM 8344]